MVGNLELKGMQPSSGKKKTKTKTNKNSDANTL